MGSGMGRSASSGAALRSSQRANLTKPSGNIQKPNQSPFDGKLVYEDPAAALNLDEGKWNEIVQNNLKNFENEKKVAKESKLAKNRAVQEA